MTTVQLLYGFDELSDELFLLLQELAILLSIDVLLHHYLLAHLLQLLYLCLDATHCFGSLTFALCLVQQQRIVESVGLSQLFEELDLNGFQLFILVFQHTYLFEEG